VAREVDVKYVVYGWVIAWVRNDSCITYI